MLTLASDRLGRPLLSSRVNRRLSLKEDILAFVTVLAVLYCAMKEAKPAKRS